MEDDWDLHAVVRECAAVFAAATNPPPSQNSFTFTGLLDDETDNKDPLVGLQEIYQDFCLDDLPPPATVIAAPATIPAAHVFQEIAQMEPPPPPPLQMNLQIQENVQLHNPITLPPPPQIFPAAIPQPTRQRRRKNQHLKMVRQMTQEELSADSWAWRKYGQKPIKGSSFPRNYYRCSTSKGCAARKQVERSQNDPGIFVVSYTGDHTHPRPTHRNSLAGSTRPKFSSPQRNTINNALLFKTGSVSSSSAATGSSFSPSTPSMEAEAASQNDDVEMAEDDDMFKGFHVDSDDHDSGGGDLFSGCLLSSPPWSPPPELP